MLANVLNKLIDNNVNQKLDYYAYYSVTIINQDQDGLVTIKPDDARLPSMEGIYIRTGIPGIKIVVDGTKRETKALLGFENGDSTKPYCCLWLQPGLVELEITAKDTISINTDSDDITIEAGGDVSISGTKIKVDSSDITLGAVGLAPVARVLDQVVVFTPTGAPLFGFILTGNVAVRTMFP